MSARRGPQKRGIDRLNYKITKGVSDVQSTDRRKRGLDKAAPDEPDGARTNRHHHADEHMDDDEDEHMVPVPASKRHFFKDLKENRVLKMTLMQFDFGKLETTCRCSASGKISVLDF